MIPESHNYMCLYQTDTGLSKIEIALNSNFHGETTPGTPGIKKQLVRTECVCYPWPLQAERSLHH